VRPVLALVVAVACTARLAACVDTTPLPYHAPSRDADAGGPTIDASIRSACRACVLSGDPTCEYSACTADERCVAFSDCLFELGCFSHPELQDRIACGQPCFEQVGIQTNDDPALVLTLPINGCTSPSNVCGEVCVGQ